MIKKVISILSVLIMLLFISCASSQPEVDDSKTEKPTVEAPVIETPDNSKTDDNISVSEEDKTGDKTSENTELTETPEESEKTEANDNTESTEDTQATQEAPREEEQETEDSENNSEDSENSADSLETDASEDNTNISTATDTEISINSSEQNTELAESEDEENVDETADDNNETSDDNEAVDEFADLEIPEDFEEPLVRDLYLPETEDDSENSDDSENIEESENTEDEENPDENLEQMGEEENSELAENSEEVDETIEEPEPEEIIIPSRSVTLRKGENLAIVYPGSGWIYMGSLAEYNNMASKGRKLGSQDTKYTLLAKEAGTQIHHFYKVDNLTGQYIDDYIEITVLDKKGSSKTTITAPAYVEVVPQKAETPAKESKPASEPKTEEEQIEEQIEEQTEIKEEKSVPASTASTTTSSTASTSSTNSVSDEADIPLLLDETNSEDEVINVEEDEIFASQEEQPQINTDEILEKAKSAFDEKQYEESFNLLTEFFEYAIDRQDEALYLQGQLLEADSSIKDIKGAVQAYELLTKNYPSSIYWNDANKRIKYLRRFYYLSN